MTDELGRLHVHLRELKPLFKEKCTHGDITAHTRQLIQAFVEDRIMILGDKALAAIDKGDLNEAVDLILPGLQKLREERLQVGQTAKKTKTTNKEAKKRKEAGIETKQEKLAKSMFNQLMGGFK